MRKFIVFVFLFLFSIYLPRVFASNIAVSSVNIIVPDSANQTCKVYFDISWENSWRDSHAGEVGNNISNYDAAWVFLKYSTDSGAIWSHATLSASGTSTGTGTPIEIVVSQDKKGAFVQRSEVGEDTLSVTGMQLVWDWGTDGLSASDSARIQVFTVEMVYIPEGSFYVGSNGNGFNEFQLTQIITGNASAIGGYPPVQSGSPPTINPPDANWPNGYNAHYLMKYELSQGQYRDFLNNLTATQQANRCAAVNIGEFAGRDTGNPTPQYRNGIQKQASGFVCNLDEDANFNEQEDGEWIACNYVSWGDLAAYFDWAALRPMTEMEFEKAARGPLNAIPDEYAWGSTFIFDADTLISGGRPDERVGESGRGICSYGYDGIIGPLRGGFAAQTNTSRAEAGAGFYGNMELSGNLSERPITINLFPQFTGLHGDGILDANGDGDVANWPLPQQVGAGFRGGSFHGLAGLLRTSDREKAISGDPTRYVMWGGRGARSLD